MTGRPRVVALGGGHGLAATLTALRQVTPHLTAVVTVADDGGSSGRLRAEFDVLPPGDLRMALAALTPDDEPGRAWRELLQHRFPGDGPLGGHPLGNLLLVGLGQAAGDPVAALDQLARLAGCAGRVLPASPVPLEISAMLAGGAELVGQVAVATAPEPVAALAVRPVDPPACEPAVKAIDEADWVVFGPGSWFTSVLTHLLVPGLRAALARTEARRLVMLNLAPQPGETAGFSPEAHLEALAAYAPELSLDVVVADLDSVADPGALSAAATGLGAQLVLRPVARGDGTPRHDPERLAAAYAAVMGAEGPPWQ